METQIEIYQNNQKMKINLERDPLFAPSNVAHWWVERIFMLGNVYTVLGSQFWDAECGSLVGRTDI